MKTNKPAHTDELALAPTRACLDYMLNFREEAA